MSRSDTSPQPIDAHMASCMRFTGVDVDETRGCVIAMLDDVGHLRDVHWVQAEVLRFWEERVYARGN